MKNDSHSSLTLSLIKQAHGRVVFTRRVRDLAESLSALIPSGSSALDIGGGDGTIASLIKALLPGTNIQGIEFAPRPNCFIECAPFDGGATFLPQLGRRVGNFARNGFLAAETCPFESGTNVIPQSVRSGITQKA